MKNLFVVSLMALTLGCAPQVVGPGGQQPDSLVLYAGDAGLACIVIPLQAPKQLDNARAAATCASAILTASTIDINDVMACATKADVPAKYALALGLVVNRIMARAGGHVFPTDSVAGEAVKAFLATCQVALG